MLALLWLGLVTAVAAVTSAAAVPGSCPLAPLTCPAPSAWSEGDYAGLLGRIFPRPGYDKEAMPGVVGERMPIYVSLLLVNLQELRSDLSIATLSWQLRMRWRDPDLAWDGDRRSFPDLPPNASLADAVPRIYRPLRDIWAPEFSFEYNAIAKSASGAPPLAEIRADGRVSVVHTFTVTVSLNLRIWYFPYDDQDIYTMLTLGPVDNKFLRLTLDTFDLTAQYGQGLRVFDNTEWLIRSMECVQGIKNTLRRFSDTNRVNVHFSECPTGQCYQRDFVLCRVGVRRKAGFYIINFVVPSVAITLLGMVGQFRPELWPIKQPPNKTMIALAAVMSLGLLTITMGRNVPHADTATALHRFYFSMICLTISASYASFLRLPHAVWPAEPGDPWWDPRVPRGGQPSSVAQCRFLGLVTAAHFGAVFASLAAFATPPPDVFY